MTAEDITWHSKGNDNKKAIITEELKSHLKGFLKKKDKKKEHKKRDEDFDFNYGLKTKVFRR